MRRSESVNAPSRDRQGAVTLEAIIGLPILLLVVMAIFEYGTIMVVHHAVMAAVTKGAREGAKVPTTLGAADRSRVLDAVEYSVEDVLGTHGLTVDVASGVQVVVEDSTGVGSRGQAIGVVPGVTGITDPAEVRITLRVQFANARIPNLLGTFGVDLSAKYFEMSSTSRRDCL